MRVSSKEREATALLISYSNVYQYNLRGDFIFRDKYLYNSKYKSKLGKLFPEYFLEELTGSLWGVHLRHSVKDGHS